MLVNLFRIRRKIRKKYLRFPFIPILLFLLLVSTYFLIWTTLETPSALFGSTTNWDNSLPLIIAFIPETYETETPKYFTPPAKQVPFIEPNDSRVVNSHQFSFILADNEICTRMPEGVFLFNFVHSAPSHFLHRAVIRSTWGSRRLYRRLNIVTVFVLGKPASSQVQRTIDIEYERYGDIVQEDFQDSYHNLTYKAIAAFRWITHNCQQSIYTLKTDDDIFVNVFNLVRQLRFYLRFEPVSPQFHCLFWLTMHVIRNNSSKWYVREEDFQEPFFPSYCSGSAFVVPTQIVPRLYNATFYTKFLWVDDVYISGLVAKTANVSHKDWRSIYVLEEKNLYSQLVLGGAVFGHMTGNKGFQNRLQFWKIISDYEGV